MRWVRKTAAWALFSAFGMKWLVKGADSFELHRPGKDGAVKFPFVKRTLSRTVQILLYHRVNEDADVFFPGVGIDDFHRQMAYVAENYHVCSLEEAVDRMSANDVPERALVVTFDDGYRDNFTNAFPILQECKIPATIFLATGAIGSGKPLWHDLVFQAFRTTRAESLNGFPDRGSDCPLKNLPQKLAAQGRVLEFLWSLDHERRTLAVHRLQQCLGVCNRSEANIMLSWDEIRLMYQNGISFGSHSTTHPILSKEPDDRLLPEVVESKRVIEAKLQCKVDTFAYPVGRSQDFDDRTKSVLKDTGYRCAVTTRFGVNRANHDPFELRRATPWEPDIPSFAMKLAWYRFACNA